jgi:hypothetical protein
MKVVWHPQSSSSHPNVAIGCRSCHKTPLALQEKEAWKEGGPWKENKEIGNLGSSPSKHTPLALKGEEALEEEDPLQTTAKGRDQELVNPASD